jgi:hypothetical protein
MSFDVTWAIIPEILMGRSVESEKSRSGRYRTENRSVGDFPLNDPVETPSSVVQNLANRFAIGVSVPESVS